MKIAAGSKLVMIGDSITDCDRALPVGDGDDGWGAGYVNIVGGLLGAAYGDRKIQVVNMGIGGNTVRDLQARWQSDVIELQPDWLSVMIGINDVWRQFDGLLKSETHIDVIEYEKTLDNLLGQIAGSLKGLVLMTPYFIEPNRSDAMRVMMDEYSGVVKKLALKYDAVFVDTQAAFDEALLHYHPMALAMDRVHPGTAGHAIIARAFLKAVEFEF